MSCRGCYQQRVKLGLSHLDNTYRPVYLILTETNGQGEETAPRFYCSSCAIAILDEMKLELFIIQERLSKNGLN